MSLVRYTSFYNGPAAIYTSPTGLSDPITGLPQKGGNFNVGDYADVTEMEAHQWSQQYGQKYHQGRYRIVKLGTAATAANVAFGKPAGWAIGTELAQVVISAGGTGYTNGNFTVSSTTSGGSRAATANVVVNGGIITSAQLTYPGAGFTSLPTFSLSELSGGSGGALLAQAYETANVVTSYDTSAVGGAALTNPRGIFVCTSITTAQIAANAYVIIQESGIAPGLITTGTEPAGSFAVAITGGAITASAVTTPGTTAPPSSFLGYLLNASVPGIITYIDLWLPSRQG